jgi:hypothetical protein
MRFDQTVVSPTVKPEHAVLDRVSGGQHQNRHRRAGSPKLAAHGKAVLPWEHDVEEYQVVVIAKCQLEGLVAVRRDIRGKRVFVSPFDRSLAAFRSSSTTRIRMISSGRASAASCLKTTN